MKSLTRHNSHNKYHHRRKSSGNAHKFLNVKRTQRIIAENKGLIRNMRNELKPQAPNVYYVKSDTKFNVRVEIEKHLVSKRPNDQNNPYFCKTPKWVNTGIKSRLILKYF